MKALIFATILSVAILVPPAIAQERETDALAHWTRVLRVFVNNQGEVDFRGLAKDPADLKAFVDFIAKVSPESNPALFPTMESRLAYHINAYNALAMYNVIDSGMPTSLSGLRKVGFFVFKQFSIGGRTMSLYAYENEVIRPLGDERVHFALNCMAVGCPRLPKTPFTASELDDQLDREARRFFAEPRNLQRVPETKTVRLSEILKFYREDFLRRSPNLIAYVIQYAREKIPEDYAVEFIGYDWTINDQNRTER
ncbi:MAG: hypothetical protein A3F74_16515 [Betaproteobacteria bacterium RIFCSPLOWO2_12_FULL_62_58]|nr:MAG: hypothetical protein A3F74_16515 [Betaproteobacteria bacterium RIFCSPLOWO2_12_FULL_62_58]